MTAAPVVLEYARSQSFDDPDIRFVFKSLLWMSILSGLCVGMCFLCFTEHLAAYALHMLIFGSIIFVGARSGPAMMRLENSYQVTSGKARLAMDLSATLGIALIGSGPIVYLVVTRQSQVSGEPLLAAGVGVAYGLLAVSTARHVLLYRLLATMCRNLGRNGMARGLLVLGWFKAIYEGVWLACCSLAGALLAVKNEDVGINFAFAALAGAMGFGGVWVWMIVMHAKLLRMAKR
jgi:hypothetical protein